MSKKDRLKAQKEKQDRLRKEAELEEQREREEARERQSRSAKKMMKKAKRTKPNGEPVYYLILKLLMIVLLLNCKKNQPILNVSFVLKIWDLQVTRHTLQDKIFVR